MFNHSGVDPNVLYGGLLLLTIAAGVGEFYHVVPVGTTSLLIGGIIGGGGVHAGVNLANGTARDAANSANELSKAAALVADTASKVKGN